MGDEPNAMFPTEDWDIVLASLAEHDRLYIDLAGSELPGADTFLRCLYIIMGDAIRTQWRAHTQVT